MFSYAGFKYNVPIWNTCWADPVYQKIFMTTLDGFLNGKWGVSVQTEPKK